MSENPDTCDCLKCAMWAAARAWGEKQGIPQPGGSYDARVSNGDLIRTLASFVGAALNGMDSMEEKAGFWHALLEDIDRYLKSPEIGAAPTHCGSGAVH